MDPFELLKADHKKVDELFDVLETTPGKRKLDVFKRIKAELDLHTHIEEKFLYPALEKPRETHDLTLEAYEEHKVVKTLLGELSRAKSADDEWQAKAKVLRENVEHHVKEEENELFDKADDALTNEELDVLGNRMAAEKARKQGKPAPEKVAAKNARPSKASPAKPGILSKIASLVGLGGGGATTKAAKKSSTKKAAKKSSTKKAAKKSSTKKAAKKSSTKKAAKKSSTKKAAATRSSKAGASSASKKKAGKSARVSAVNRGGAARAKKTSGAKRASKKGRRSAL